MRIEERSAMRASAKNKILIGLFMSGLTSVGTAHAGIPVFDVVNATSNIIQNFQLKAIKHSLTNTGNGTINNYTNNIDNSTKNIDKSIHENTEIWDTDFTWIINTEHGDEEVPIPAPVAEKLNAVLDGKTSDEYASAFQAAAYYEDVIKEENIVPVSMEGSRARKAANDALVKSIELDQAGLTEDAGSLAKFMEKGIQAKGHGHQLQVANALAGTEVNQLMQLRSMMLVSEAAHAAEAQAAADKESRAIATSRALRADLQDARLQTMGPQTRQTF
jgi:conjugal transfer/entry exclusion protein